MSYLLSGFYPAPLIQAGCSAGSSRSDPAPTYAQRGTNVLQTIFKEHFPDYADSYDEMYAPTYGRFRLERITEVVENFMSCGDYTKGIARIQCTNPECKEEFFRPFSCKGFHLCPGARSLPVHRNAPLSLLNTWRITFSAGDTQVSVLIRQ